MSDIEAIRAEELAEMLPVHVMRLANTTMGLSLMDWDEISNDILEAATLLSLLTASQARAEAAEARVGELERLIARIDRVTRWNRAPGPRIAEIQQYIARAMKGAPDER